MVQLVHAGRIARPVNTFHGRRAVAPSVVRLRGVVFTVCGLQDMPAPRVLSTREVAVTVEDFRRGAAAAVVAGAGGVEIHGASGCLVHQFLADSTNRRTDGYGGSFESRIRFAVEVAAAVADEIGAERTGLRISPGNPCNDIAESDTAELYPALLRALGPLGLAYLHVMPAGEEELLGTVRGLWPTTLVLNRGGTGLPVRVKDIDNGTADLVCVGALALANPDLVERLRDGAPLNTPDPATFYGGGAVGYTDYPTHTG
ncbi:alkene reductase [Streptomyces griseoruber]|uniref:oxidoreductase n=1 Tax=Streptomyces griseoruber TaxID=1943 RepID=UPI000A57D847|nr:alkene reductase [Streptomyces griseoruber]